MGTNRVPWWDQVAYLVRRTEKQILRIGYPSDRIFTLDDSSRLSVIDALLSLYKSEETKDPERFLTGVEEACGVARPREASDRLFMSWEEARKLVKGGMSIGSHTHDHEVLAKLSPEQQLRQCQLSREMILQELGLTVQAFEHERNIAARLQIGMLPTEVPRYGRFELGSAARPPTSPARARPSVRWITWRRSRSAVRRSAQRPTSTRSAA